MINEPQKQDIKKGAEPPLRIEKPPQQPPLQAPKSQPKPMPVLAPKKSNN